MAILAYFILILVVGFTADFLLNMGKIRRLQDMEPEEGEYPSVSLIIPVRNEEEHLESALSSVLGLDYPELEIVVIDDRSTDRTPEILARMAKTHPSLIIRRIDSLPKGWLGKNHAMHIGAAAARGDYLLFTDADVHFAPDTLSRALTFLKKENAAFLTVFPEMILKTTATRIFAATFIVLFNGRQRPWSIENPKSKAGFSIGAFGLIRRDAYDKIGTHAAWALYPEDDLELGRRTKEAGYPCRILEGAPLVKFPWYPSIWESVKGFEKNFFAGLNFSIPYALFSLTMLAMLYLFPWIAVWFPGPEQKIFALVCGTEMSLFYFVLRHFGVPGRYGFGYPFGVAIFIFVALRSMAITLRQGGIRWRDTFYPLEDLRAARRK